MKVKPRKAGRVRRRLVTISLYASCWLLLSALMPLWIIVGVLVGAVRRRAFIVLRLLCFAWFYFGFELLALLLVGCVFMMRRRAETRYEKLYRLQAWWANLNLRVAQRLLRLRVDVEGTELAMSGPVILLVRHASILDTLLPCAFIQRPHGLRVRYVLKQELLLDPCIDIVGNALPNYFVDRSGETSCEIKAIRALVADLGTDAVLIFPEGTRFSRKKREKALARLEPGPLREAARAMTRVLPPKPGGVLALLQTLPDVDCVFLAHAGLETFAKIQNLLSGEVVGSTVSMKLWRVPANDIPTERSERLTWLYHEWQKVDAFIEDALAES